MILNSYYHYYEDHDRKSLVCKVVKGIKLLPQIKHKLEWDALSVLAAEVLHVSDCIQTFQVSILL